MSSRAAGAALGVLSAPSATSTGAGLLVEPGALPPPIFPLPWASPRSWLPGLTFLCLLPPVTVPPTCTQLESPSRAGVLRKVSVSEFVVGSGEGPAGLCSLWPVAGGPEVA